MCLQVLPPLTAMAPTRFCDGFQPTRSSGEWCGVTSCKMGKLSPNHMRCTRALIEECSPQ
jgi:hypothetical protein